MVKAPLKIMVSGELRVDRQLLSSFNLTCKFCYGCVPSPGSKRRSPKLGAAQRLFLESATEKCRYMSDQEVTRYWPEYAAATAAVPKATAK